MTPRSTERVRQNEGFARFQRALCQHRAVDNLPTASRYPRYKLTRNVFIPFIVDLTAAKAVTSEGVVHSTDRVSISAVRQIVLSKAIMVVDSKIPFAAVCYWREGKHALVGALKTFTIS